MLLAIIDAAAAGGRAADRLPRTLRAPRGRPETPLAAGCTRAPLFVLSLTEEVAAEMAQWQGRTGSARSR